MLSHLLFFALLASVLSITFTQPAVAYFRLRSMNVDITFQQCLLMSMRKALNEEVIKALDFSQCKGLDVSLEMIEAQYLSGGFPLRCVQAMEYAQSKGLNLAFRQIAAADLADKNLYQAIDRACEPYMVHTSNLHLKDVNQKVRGYEYNGSFRLDFGRACFAFPDNKAINKEVDKKIMSFFRHSDLTDKLITPQEIGDGILDSQFWESKGLNLQNQEIKIVM